MHDLSSLSHPALYGPGSGQLRSCAPSYDLSSGQVRSYVKRYDLRSDRGRLVRSDLTWQRPCKHAATRQPRRKPAAETCVDNTAKLRPQASVLALRAAGACQLLKLSPTAPRSYGRRHRSWHSEPQAQTNCLNLRRQHREATCTCNAQRGAPRATACKPRSSTCVAPQASA
jgi:hypothetical protein